MMPVIDGTQSDEINYKQKYKTLKRKLKFLVYEQECFLDELRKAQKKLLKVSRDRSFLLDRLLQHEQVEDSTSESEATASSEEDGEGNKEGSSTKKKKVPQSQSGMAAFSEAATSASSLLGSMAFSPMMGTQPAIMQTQSSKSSEPPKKRAKTSKKVKSATLKTPEGTKTVTSVRPKTEPSEQPGQMTREELERHLDSCQSSRPQFMTIERAPHHLPDDIFSNENSNPESESNERPDTAEEEDNDLVIDMPE